MGTLRVRHARADTFFSLLTRAGFKTYADYLAGKHWKRFRRHRLQRRPCECCGRDKATRLHHLTYRRLGHELDADVVAICKACHDKIHALLDEKYPGVQVFDKTECTFEVIPRSRWHLWKPQEPAITVTKKSGKPSRAERCAAKLERRAARKRRLRAEKYARYPNDTSAAIEERRQRLLSKGRVWK